MSSLDYLYAAAPPFHLVGASAYKPGLDTTLHLMEAVGNPHRSFPAVHVAGTNGKGSTSHLIAAALQSAGLKVGLYTSPHLVDFCERIRINGMMMPTSYLDAFVEQYKPLLDELHPSFFEITTALAFRYFADEQVDIAVIEVGLGGRLDATNIITPLLSVITNIGLDHEEFLGATLTAIAEEKAGIIKPFVPCVIGETNPETAPVFLRHAANCSILGEGLETTNCRLWFADQCGYLRRRRLQTAPDSQLHGLYQEHNLQTAYVALQVLRNHCHIPVSEQHIADGFAHVCTITGLRGRWETLSETPLTICDTGHNSHGIRYVAEQLKELGQTHTLHIVFGMVDDKDVDVVLSLMPEDAFYYFTQADTHRAVPADTMIRLWLTQHPAYPSAHAAAFSSVKSALLAAQSSLQASPSTTKPLLFIGGSNYVVGEALPFYSNS